MARAAEKFRVQKTLTLCSFLNSLLKYFDMRSTVSRGIVCLEHHKTVAKSALTGLIRHLKETSGKPSSNINFGLRKLVFDRIRERKKLAHALHQLCSITDPTFDEIRQVSDILLVDSLKKFETMPHGSLDHLFPDICRQYLEGFRVLCHEITELYKKDDAASLVMKNILNAVISVMGWVIEYRLMYAFKQDSVVKFRYSYLMMQQDLALNWSGPVGEEKTRTAVNLWDMWQSVVNPRKNEAEEAAESSDDESVDLDMRTGTVISPKKKKVSQKSRKVKKEPEWIEVE